MPSNPAHFARRAFPTAHRLALEAGLGRRLKAITGRVLALGVGHDPYGKFLTNAKKVVRTDIDGETGQIDVIADAHELPFHDGSFDAIVAIEVLEHLRDPVRATREMHRVLRRGGCCVISIPFMFHVHGDPNDYSRFTRSGLEQLFRNHASTSIFPFGGRLHVVSDIVTTAWKPLLLLRVLNNLLRISALNITSEDCPSGYWVEATK